MIKLDDRLFAVARSIDNCGILADIGSDHGYLPIYLLMTKKIKKAIITDINHAPLQSSIQNAKNYQVSEQCDFIRGNGLVPLKNKDCDVISICGMGGDTIAQIILDNLSTALQADKVVLQPMTNQVVLRKTLVENNFEITNEKMVKDRHLFYQIITAKKGISVGYDSELDLEFPKSLLNIKDAVFLQFLIFKLELEEIILKNIISMSKKSNDMLIDQTQIRINYMKELIRTYES